MNFKEVVEFLENLGVMPKTMPGLHKISKAVSEKIWFKNLDSRKIITIAGTNGKGTTAAALEALLLDANQKVGLFTSPHLIQTTERIRLNGFEISEELFIEIFKRNRSLIEKYELSHFESLTLMASDLFFQSELDYVIFEVGLGGVFDATNIFPNHYSVITKIGLDHQNILGHDIVKIAENKFGIVKNNSLVIHHILPQEVFVLKDIFQCRTNSKWIEAPQFLPDYNSHEDAWYGASPNEVFKTNMIGSRAIENISTAISVFIELGFNFSKHKTALNNLNWPGRMQKIRWPKLKCPLYLSGDHNIQGVLSLIDLLKNYKYQNIHIIVGIGLEKSYEDMLNAIVSIPRMSLYLTETPFKGLPIQVYPEKFSTRAVLKNKNIFEIFKRLNPLEHDLILVTGSLYLVGEVLKQLSLENLES